MIKNLWIIVSEEVPSKYGLYEVVAKVMDEDGKVRERITDDYWTGEFRFYGEDVVAWRELENKGE